MFPAPASRLAVAPGTVARPPGAGWTAPGGRRPLPPDRTGQPEEFLLAQRGPGRRAVATCPGGDDLQAQLVRAVPADSGVPAGAAHDPVAARLADDGQAALRVEP